MHINTAVAVPSLKEQIAYTKALRQRLMDNECCEGCNAQAIEIVERRIKALKERKKRLKAMKGDDGFFLNGKRVCCAKAVMHRRCNC